MRNRFVHKLMTTTLLGAFVLGTLSACGIKGDLKTPPPLWGDKTQIDQNKAEKSQADKNKTATPKVEKLTTEKSKP